MRRLLFATLVLALLAAADHRAATPATLAVAGRANANVSMASAGRVVVAVWSAATAAGPADIFSATSRDGGISFAAPVRVNQTPGDARVNGEQPPRVAIRERTGQSPEIAVVWTAKGTTGTKLLQAISADGGSTFGPSRTVADTDTAGNRGWEGLGVGPRGRFFSVWLDHRRLAQNETRVAGQHQHNAGSPMPAAKSDGKTDGVAMAQLSQLYVAALDGTTAPVAVTGGVCYCCKTAIVSGGADALYVAWRHVYPGNLRDIAFAASRDGGRTFSAPVRVSEDKWHLEGCPDDGPAMVTDARGRIHIVWPTVVNENGGPVKVLFYASSADGKVFGPRQRIPAFDSAQAAQANHPQLAIDGRGRLLATWDEMRSGTRRVMTALGTADAAGRVTFARGTALAEVGSYPVVVPTPAGWLVAWTTGAPDQSVIRLATIGS